jgi:hypothetical protein
MLATSTINDDGNTARSSLMQLKPPHLHGLTHCPMQVNNCIRERPSAVNITVKHEVTAFVRHKFFNDLITEKWSNFAFGMYLRSTVIPYVFLLTIFTAFLVFRADEIHLDLVGGSSSNGNSTSELLYCVQDPAAWAWDGTVDSVSNSSSDRGWVAGGQLITSFILQLTIMSVGVPFLMYKGCLSRRLKLRDLDTDENGSFSHAEVLSFIFKNANFLLSLGASAALCTSFVARVKCEDHMELEAEAVASVLLFANLLILLMPFRYIGELVITIYRMFVGDVFCFLVVFIVLQLGFSLSILALARNARDPSRNFGQSLGVSFLQLMWVSLGDNLSENVSDLFGSESAGLIMAITSSGSSCRWCCS